MDGKKKEIDNRNYVFRKIYGASKINKIGEDIVKLTQKNARLNLVEDPCYPYYLILYVYCRKKNSKVYDLCVELNFKEEDY